MELEHGALYYTNHLFEWATFFNSAKCNHCLKISLNDYFFIMISFKREKSHQMGFSDLF